MYNQSDIDRVARNMIHRLGDRAASKAADMVREQAAWGSREELIRRTPHPKPSKNNA
jgi:hypothetical protein